MACCFAKFCIFEERLDFTLLSGLRLSGPVDKARRDIPTESTQLGAKTIDLKVLNARWTESSLSTGVRRCWALFWI